MYNYHAILSRVGIVLIAVGILVLTYWYMRDQPQCILNPSATISSPPGSVTLVVLGVLFLRRNLQIVPIVTWCAALIFSYLVSSLVTLPFLFPIVPTEIWGIAFRIDPVGNFMPILVKIMGIAVAFWVYRQLRAAPVVSAVVRSGHSNYVPSLKLAFILGIALVAVPLSIGFFYLTPDNAAIAKAVEIARTEYGEGYKYYVRGIIIESKGYIRACVSAYNEQEIKVVPVEWEQ